jgi:hypothetical protein
MNGIKGSALASARSSECGGFSTAFCTGYGFAMTRYSRERAKAAVNAPYSLTRGSLASRQRASISKCGGFTYHLLAR